MKNTVRLFDDSYINWKILVFTERGRRFWTALDEYMTSLGGEENAPSYGFDTNVFLIKHCVSVLKSADFTFIALAEKLKVFFEEYEKKYKKAYTLSRNSRGRVDGVAVINEMSVFFRKEEQDRRDNDDMYYWEKAYNLFYLGDEIRTKCPGVPDEESCIIDKKVPHVVNKAFLRAELPPSSWYLFRTDLPLKLDFTVAAALCEEPDTVYNRELLADLTVLSQMIMEGKYMWNGSVIEIGDMVNKIMPPALNADHNKITLKRLKRAVASDHSVYCAYADSILSGRDPHWMLETALMNVRFASGRDVEPEKVREMSHLQLINSIFTEASDYFEWAKKETREVLAGLSDLTKGAEDMLFEENRKPDVQLDELPYDISPRLPYEEPYMGYSYHFFLSDNSGFKIGADNPLRSWMASFNYILTKQNYPKFENNETYKDFIKGPDTEGDEEFSMADYPSPWSDVCAYLPDDFDFRPFTMIREILSLDDMIKFRYFDVLSIKKTLSSCARTLHLIGRRIKGFKGDDLCSSVEEGNKFLALAEDVLEYCYKNSEAIKRKLDMYAGAPLSKSGLI